MGRECTWIAEASSWQLWKSERELWRWIPLSRNISESNRIGIELLITDCKTALTLLDLAATTAVIEEPQHAYETIVSFRERLSPTPEQEKQLSELLKALKRRLGEIGVRVE